MITSIQGTLESAAPLSAIVEVGGFGYEVHVPLTTSERLPKPGTAVRLHTLVIYREDAQTLYGFATTADRDFFRLMVEHVTGIGPKLALSIMSRLSLPLLESAIRSGDVGTLSKCPGIGRKTAERMVIELKSKVGAIGPLSGGAADGSTAPSGPHADAVAALVALGYKTADADGAVRRASAALGAGATTETLLKKALG